MHPWCNHSTIWWGVVALRMRWRLIVAGRGHVVAVWMGIEILLLQMMLLFGHTVLLL